VAENPLRAAGPRPEAEIVAAIARGGAAVVALSGGVDSALVAALAREALGDRATAVTLTGSAVAASEVAVARAVARTVGIAHVVVGADPLTRDDYRANRPDRCYHCRSVEAGAVRAWAADRAIDQFLDGVHADDLGDDRPGLRAMEEAGFRHPLLVASWGKVDVRAAARRRGLPNWDRPSNACLASRVAHGTPIDPDLLARIDAAEQLVAARGFRRVRVRVSPAGARIEVDPDEVARLTSAPTATEVAEAVRRLGFARVEIDPRGYGALRAGLTVLR